MSDALRCTVPPDKAPDIIALLIVGVLLVAAFLTWQWYLEKKLGQGSRLPPPIMKLSMWTRANGRFTVMQFIAFLSWCSFLSYNFWVQLFYQRYLHLSPILTMVRLLPMFVTGVCWYVLSENLSDISENCLNSNVIIALIVGRVDVVYLMSSWGSLLCFSHNLILRHSLQRLVQLAQPARTYSSQSFGLPSHTGPMVSLVRSCLYLAPISCLQRAPCSLRKSLFPTNNQSEVPCSRP